MCYGNIYIYILIIDSRNDIVYKFTHVRPQTYSGRQSVPKEKRQGDVEIPDCTVGYDKVITTTIMPTEYLLWATAITMHITHTHTTIPA